MKQNVGNLSLFLLTPIGYNIWRTVENLFSAIKIFFSEKLHMMQYQIYYKKYNNKENFLKWVLIKSTKPNLWFFKNFSSAIIKHWFQMMYIVHYSVFMFVIENSKFIAQLLITINVKFALLTSLRILSSLSNLSFMETLPAKLQKYYS